MQKFDACLVTLLVSDTARRRLKGPISPTDIPVGEMPSHSHQYSRLPRLFNDTDYSKSDQANFRDDVRNSSNIEYTQTENVGGNKAHNLLSPVIACYFWQRSS